MKIQVDLNRGLVYPAQDWQVKFFTRMLLKYLNISFYLLSPLHVTELGCKYEMERQGGGNSHQIPLLMTKAQAPAAVRILPKVSKGRGPSSGRGQMGLAGQICTPQAIASPHVPVSIKETPFS